GPTRHGKSTLLNAIMGVNVLPVSDLRPCTAAIIRCKYGARWKLTAQFMTLQAIEDERREACSMARALLESPNDSEAPDISSILSPFQVLQGLPERLPPAQLLTAVESGAILPEVSEEIRGIGQYTAASHDELARHTQRLLTSTGRIWPALESC